MNKLTVSKKALLIGTAITWAGVLLGVSVLTEAEGDRALDWELMWVIVGGFLMQNILLKAFFKNYEDR